ncbi:CDP-diglyceride synthase [Micractinium conductrix]|uniref:CDP-diglyceride synthase n=1 Tax=Micractinium conductrix TaxID=554055 RepID=A0A2P6V3K2_9CHLO|nr:CDP-diglyceride synthase [Micractinium conductrix]|eukprot:PSC68673.1 CDP-diglyceride synthase [Micractinium conductrix]
MLLARTALARKAQPSPLDTALLAFPYHQPAGGHQLRQWRGRSLQIVLPCLLAALQLLPFMAPSAHMLTSVLLCLLAAALAAFAAGVAASCCSWAAPLCNP